MTKKNGILYEKIAGVNSAMHERVDYRKKRRKFREFSPRNSRGNPVKKMQTVDNNETVGGGVRGDDDSGSGSGSSSGRMLRSRFVKNHYAKKQR